MNPLIESPLVLRALRDSSLHGVRQVTLALQGLSPDENAAGSRVISSQLASCGCALGTGAFLAYLAVLTTLCVVEPAAFQALHGGVSLALWLAAPLVAGAFKLAGRAAALAQARREIDLLHGEPVLVKAR